MLSEIDVQATAARERRGVQMEPYVILGACNPDLAHRALDIDRSIGVLLPCNVVVSGHDRGAKMQILDPLIMAAVMAPTSCSPSPRTRSPSADRAGHPDHPH